MLLGDVLSKAQLALKRTQHEVLKMRYEDIIDYLKELRDDVENFNHEAWNSCNHNEFIMFTKLAGKNDEREAQEDIEAFLDGYADDLCHCVIRSNPSESRARLDDGWDIRI